MTSNILSFKQDVMLTNYIRLLGPSLGSFIADDIFPATSVPTKSGQFYSLDGGFSSASPGHDMVMADGQSSPLLLSTSISKATGWEVDLNGLGCQLSKSTAEFAKGNGLNMRQAKAAILAREVAINRERQAAAIAFSTTVFTGKTTALSGSDQWDNAASDPVSIGQTARDTIIKASGEAPDTVIIGYEVYKALRQHPALVEFSSRTQSSVGIVTNDDIARALDVENVYVGKAVANTAEENLTAVKAYIWGKFALWCKLRPSPAPMTPQSCLQRWKFQGSTDGAVRRWEPTPYVEQIDVLYTDQMAAPTTELGYLYSTVVS